MLFSTHFQHIFIQQQRQQTSTTALEHDTSSPFFIHIIQMKHALFFIILFVFLGLGICQPNAVFTSTGCVDPDDLDECLDEAGHASYDDYPPQESECPKYIRSYECYAKNCWNRVSSHQSDKIILTNITRFTNANTKCTSWTISWNATMGLT